MIGKHRKKNRRVKLKITFNKRDQLNFFISTTSVPHIECDCRVEFFLKSHCLAGRQTDRQKECTMMPLDIQLITYDGGNYADWMDL